MAPVQRGAYPVEVRGLSILTGEVTFGPESVYSDTQVQEIRRRIQEACLQEGRVNTSVQLFQGGQALYADTQLSALDQSEDGIVDFQIHLRELNEREVAELLALIQEDWAALGGDDASALAADQAAVLMAVRQNGKALQFASEHLRADKEFVKQCVAIDPAAMQYVKKSLRNDKAFVRTVLATRGAALEHVAVGLKADRSTVMLAVQQDFAALAYADFSLLSSRDFMTEMVEKDTHAFRLAAPSLRRDRDFVKISAARDVSILQYADRSLMAERDFVLQLVRRSWKAFRYASKQLQEDKQLLGIAGDLALNYTSLALLSGKGGAAVNAERNMALAFASESFQKQRSLMKVPSLPAISGLRKPTPSCTEMLGSSARSSGRPTSSGRRAASIGRLVLAA
eukprot:TRINITY_DN9431_c1_g1_i1.p1 TRINITY_DN9431_c1_g1~~TRINITY_DN9431_c1_g1_i1.p1  ORF type:complete len:397 (-),score=94.25 TRINITY_DN9431_c1_g1_i1:310-1500(-)